MNITSQKIRFNPIDEVKQLGKPALEELEEIIKELSGDNVTVSDVKNFPEDE